MPDFVNPFRICLKKCASKAGQTLTPSRLYSTNGQIFSVFYLFWHPTAVAVRMPHGGCTWLMAAAVQQTMFCPAPLKDVRQEGTNRAIHKVNFSQFIGNWPQIAQCMASLSICPLAKYSRNWSERVHLNASWTCIAIYAKKKLFLCKSLLAACKGV